MFPLTGMRCVIGIFHSPQCCQTLLSHRVDPFLRDEDGYTAMDLADYHGHQDCAQYLREMSRPVKPGGPVCPGGLGRWAWQLTMVLL